MNTGLNHCKVMKWCIVFLLLIPFLFSGCIYGPTLDLPDGEWYCQELGMQIGSGEGMETFVETENGTLRCKKNMTYSGYIIVEYQEDGAEYPRWETIFCGVVVYKSDDALLIREDGTNHSYWFFRCD